MYVRCVCVCLCSVCGVCVCGVCVCGCVIAYLRFGHVNLKCNNEGLCFTSDRRDDVRMLAHQLP